MRALQGYFVAPTVITGVADTSRCVKEEIFGPVRAMLAALPNSLARQVVVVVPFDTEEEVIERANDNAYGLAATIWTQNGGVANRVALQLHVRRSRSQAGAERRRRARCGSTAGWCATSTCPLAALRRRAPAARAPRQGMQNACIALTAR